MILNKHNAKYNFCGFIGLFENTTGFTMQAPGSNKKWPLQPESFAAISKIFSLAIRLPQSGRPALLFLKT